MIRFLVAPYYCLRYIYWTARQLSRAINGDWAITQARVESISSQRTIFGFDQVNIRYRYSVYGLTYFGSATRDCLVSGSNQKLLSRFPVGAAASIRFDLGEPQHSYLPLDLVHVNSAVALIPSAALLVLWGWFLYITLHGTTSPVTASVQPSHATACPAGLPGTPESAINLDPNAAAGLTTFNSREGEFSILMPQTSSYSSVDNLPSAYGPLIFRRFTFKTSNGDYYEAGYGDVPGTGPISLPAWLNYSSNARLQGSFLIDRHNINLGGTPGIAYTGLGINYLWSERIYFVGRRFYRITISTQRSTCTWPADAAAFLDSFRTTHSKN